MKESQNPSTIQQRLPREAQKFIQEIRPYCSSIVLGGSRAKSVESEGSDIDLCIICPNNQGKSKVVSFFRGIGSEKPQQRVLVDAKIFSEEEFVTVIQGTQNAFWYTFISNGLVIHGAEVNVTLFSHQFRNTVWAAIDELRESIDLIEKNVFPEIIGYKVYSAISTCYTIECLHYCRPFSQIERAELISQVLGDQKQVMKTLYDCIRKRMRMELATQVLSTDFKLTKTGHCRTIVDSNNFDRAKLEQSIQHALHHAEELYHILGD